MTPRAATNQATVDLGHGRAAPRPWRELWAIERNEPLLAGAQSAMGKLVLVAAFAAAAHVVGISLPYAFVAAAFAYLPAYRNWIVLATALIAAARSSGVLLQALQPVLEQEGVHPSTGRALVWAALAIYFVGAWAALMLIRRHPGLWLARRPVVSLLTMGALLGALASFPLIYGWPRVALWALLCVFTAYVWVFAYAVQDQRSLTPGALSFQLGIFHPFWRSSAWSLSPTPFGKGAAFLRRHQAHTAEELAVTQLKALKLLVWALVLMGLHKALSHLLEERMGIPNAASMYAAFQQGKPFATSMNWASLVWATLGGTMVVAVWGHKIIAIARLAGFRLPRNTWRPLESRTLAEFWNRYYYYFKELLVEFFFFPTFLRVFRKHPRLRVFFATFMAAGVGNAIYHFIRDIPFAASMGWNAAAVNFVSYLVYCTALATGIGISQARISFGRKLPTTWAGRLWAGLCVWTFFVCLHVFGYETTDFPFSDRAAFFISLFGVS